MPTENNSHPGYQPAEGRGPGTFNAPKINYDDNEAVDYRLYDQPGSPTPAYRYERADMAYEDFISTLKREPTSRDELERQKEALETDYAATLNVGEAKLISALGMLGRYEAPYPYNGRTEFGFFDGAKGQVEYMVDIGKIPAEKQGWTTRILTDLEQQEATLRVIAGMGGSVGGYYDILRQFQALLSNERYHTSMGDIISWLAAEDEGLTNAFDPSQFDDIEDPDQRQILIDNLRKQTEQLNGLAKEGLRKEIIRKQDDSRLWIMATAATAQYDPEDVGKESFMPALTAKKLLLLQHVFGNGQWVNFKYQTEDGEKNFKTPTEINNWYSSGDKVIERREYQAKMIELVNIQNEQGAGLWDTIESLNSGQVISLAEKIKVASSRRVKYWKKPYDELHDRVTKRVIDTWIQTDLGLMASGHMGWGWIYNNDGTRVWDAGGIYKAFDSMNGRNWVLKKMAYDASIEEGEHWTLGTHHGIRERWIKNKPGWSPPIAEAIDTRIPGNEVQKLKNDANLQKIWDFWFDPAWAEERKLLLVGKDGTLNGSPDIDPELKQWLMVDSNPWRWESWVPDPVTKQFLDMPVFFPVQLDIVNAWDYMGDQKKGGLTVWKKWANGVKPSEIDWKEQNFEALDRHWVSMNFGFRFLRKMIDPLDEKDETVNLGTGSGPDAKDVSKRIKKFFRDAGDSAQPFNMLAGLLPYTVVQNLINKHGMMSGTFATDNNKYSAFWVDVVKWAQTFQDLPAKVGGKHITMPRYENFGNDLAIMTYGYAMRAMYISQSVAEANRYKEQSKYEAVSAMVTGKTDTKLDGILRMNVAGMNVKNMGVDNIRLDASHGSAPKER